MKLAETPILPARLPYYLTGASNPSSRAAASGELRGQLGLLIAPGNASSYAAHVPDYSVWAMDNGCFTSGGAFDGDEYLRTIDRILKRHPEAHDRALFATAPDVFDPVAMKGDPRATLERSAPYFDRIRDAGMPVALVAQDGLEDMMDEIPWDDFDTLFLGGSDDFKLGYFHEKKSTGYPVYLRGNGASERWALLMNEALERGKDIHVGRSNSYARLNWGYQIGANSADGTLLAFGPEKNLERIKKWYPKLWGDASAAYAEVRELEESIPESVWRVAEALMEKGAAA